MKELEAVGKAVTSMIPEVSDPRIELNPLRFIVSMESSDGGIKDFDLSQMGGGHRIVLALAADLARRVAQGNPHLEDPLRSESIVLIDEVDLHLHPEWQQRVLTDLLNAFPKTQFIVSTHSPQVLTTVHPENIASLRPDDDGIIVNGTTGPTFGAESGAALSTVTGVGERPRNNEFVKMLERYTKLVHDDKGETKEAKRLRGKMKEISPYDCALAASDAEIVRRKILGSSGSPP